MADDKTVLEPFYFIYTVNVLILDIFNNKIHQLK